MVGKKITYPKRTKTHLNHPPWLEKILKFTYLKLPKHTSINLKLSIYTICQHEIRTNEYVNWYRKLYFATAPMKVPTYAGDHPQLIHEFYRGQYLLVINGGRPLPPVIK